MEPFKSSYSPEEFFQVIKMKNSTENPTNLSSSIPAPTAPPPPSPLIMPSTSLNSSLCMNLPQTPELLNSDHQQSATNSFAYSSPDEFIKAVMSNNNSQQTGGGFSSANAKSFEDFYKNKLKSVPPLNSFPCERNTSGGNHSSSSASFKSAIAALPKVIHSNSSTFCSIKNLPQQQQQQQQSRKGARGEAGGGDREVGGWLSSSSSSTVSSHQSSGKNHDVKIKINKVKEKLAKLAMKNCSDNKLPRFKKKNQNFEIATIKHQNNEIISSAGTSGPTNKGKFPVITNENLLRNEIYTRYFDNKQQQQKYSSSRSVSESEGSVRSVVSSINKEPLLQRQQQQRQQKLTNESDNIFQRDRLQSAHSIDSLSTTPDTSKSQKKRQRRKRGGQKKSDSQDDNVTDDQNITISKTNYPHLNSESLLILDLLSLPSEKRDTYLLQIAEDRKLLIQATGPNSQYELHPKIQHYHSFLRLGKNSAVNEEETKRLRNILDKISTQFKKEKTIKYFEDHVNAIVHEGLPNDKIAEFTFPLTPKRQRHINYFKTKDFVKRLEDFANKCCNAGLGDIIEGEIRINGKNNEQAFVKHIDGERDAMFQPQLIRKFALHGDIVRAFIRKPQTQSLISSSANNQNSKNDSKTNNDKVIVDNNIIDVISPNSNLSSSTSIPVIPAAVAEEGIGLASLVADDNIEGDDDDDETDIKIQLGKSCKGFVIQILQEVHNRKCVGTFLSYRKNTEYITFVPRDMKLPVMKIYKENWPEQFKNNQLDKITDTLYAAKIIEWKNEQCVGKILHAIGKCDELDSENNAILYQNNLNMEEYDDKFNKMFYGPLIIDEDEIAKRKDMRNECIFTIDPLTARDLDDALSCKKLSDNNYEIGVHISDVSYFLHENNELDDIVSKRTTSVYMVNEVYHMLPKSLCFKCSLLPGEDKLAFSIFWIINDLGQVLDYYIKRTIINSCTQFAYQHAQMIIDNPTKNFTENDFPQIHNGFKVSKIVECVRTLHKIATILRKKRFDNGSLRINRPKISFEINPNNGEPLNYYVYELDTANYMIEEFMLLANQYVAKFIYEHYPKISILRNHEPPKKNVILTLQDRLAKLGINFDINNSKSIHESMNNVIKNCKYPDAMEICLAHLVSKPMKRATYFCSDKASTKDDFWHFALSIPIYTHFTSPIRRYPDILVHRILSAALGYTPPPTKTPEDLHVIANICNEMKYNAKIAGEDSSNLYFKHFIKSKKSVIFRAAVLEIFSYSMEVILIETGHIIRIHFPRDSKKKGYKVTVNTSKIPFTAILTFNHNSNTNTNSNSSKTNINNENIDSCPSIEMKMFSEVLIEVQIGDNKKLKGSIAIPSEFKKYQQVNNDKNDEKKNNENDDDLNLKSQIKTVSLEEKQKLEDDIELGQECDEDQDVIQESEEEEEEDDSDDDDDDDDDDEDEDNDDDNGRK